MEVFECPNEQSHSNWMKIETWKKVIRQNLSAKFYNVNNWQFMLIQLITSYVTFHWPWLKPVKWKVTCGCLKKSQKMDFLIRKILEPQNMLNSTSPTIFFTSVFSYANATDNTGMRVQWFNRLSTCGKMNKKNCKTIIPLWNTSNSWHSCSFYRKFRGIFFLINFLRVLDKIFNLQSIILMLSDMDPHP